MSKWRQHLQRARVAVFRDTLADAGLWPWPKWENRLRTGAWLLAALTTAHIEEHSAMAASYEDFVAATARQLAEIVNAPPPNVATTEGRLQMAQQLIDSGFMRPPEATEHPEDTIGDTMVSRNGRLLVCIGDGVWAPVDVIGDESESLPTAQSVK